MAKIDLKKELKTLYSPSAKKAKLVEVPDASYFMIDGKGDPNVSEDFQRAVESLYSSSYALKFAMKKQGTDYTVMPLEGLWWAKEFGRFLSGDKSSWEWTLMIMQPGFVTEEDALKAAEGARQKKGLQLSPRFESYHEGLSAQIMHIGPFSTEASTVQNLHEFISSSGLVPVGKHHEIYLSDPRRANPEKMKTIIRQPVREQE